MKPSGVRIRLEVLDRLADEHGWTSDAELARQLGLSHATITNLRAGRATPGPKVIHQCLTVFGDQAYSQLFHRVEL